MTSTKGNPKEVSATRAISRAWRDVGSHPSYHIRQQERLCREWPAMHQAIIQAIQEVELEYMTSKKSTRVGDLSSKDIGLAVTFSSEISKLSGLVASVSGLLREVQHREETTRVVLSAPSGAGHESFTLSHDQEVRFDT